MRKTIIILLSFSSLCLSGCSMLPLGEVSQGVTFNNQDISGYSKNEVREMIEKQISVNKPQIILVNDEGKETKVDAAELGITVDVDKAVNQIFEVGYEPSIIDAIKSRWGSYRNPVNIPLKYELNGPIAQNYLVEYSKKIDKAGTDAYITLENGSIVKHQALVGKSVKVKDTYDALNTMVNSQKFGKLFVVMDKKKQPKVSDNDIANINTILASFSTQYDSSSTNRSHNIQLATEKINGNLVHSGESFSFNNIVGERSAEAGYDDAPVMVDGKLEPGIGGGICQVSTTLFNATLLSGMVIEDRTSHYAAVGYIPQGRDATVAYGYLDYIFKNPFTLPVYVLARAENGIMTVYILGSTTNKLKSVDIQVTDPTPNPDVPGGTLVKTTRTMIFNDGHKQVDTYTSDYEPMKS